jgi:hypothetical protein
VEEVVVRVVKAIGNQGTGTAIKGSKQRAEQMKK